MNLNGVIPAALTPRLDDLSLDRASLQRHLQWLLATPGALGVPVNGNTSEIGASSKDKQVELITTARQYAREDQVVLSGIQLSTAFAMTERAMQWGQVGALALVIFPPERVAESDPDDLASIKSSLKLVAGSTDLPLIFFQYPLASGRSYSLRLIERLASHISTFAGVKDFCCDEDMHQINAVQNKYKNSPN